MLPSNPPHNNHMVSWIQPQTPSYVQDIHQDDKDLNLKFVR